MHPHESKNIRNISKGSSELALPQRHLLNPINLSIDFRALETEDVAQGPPKLECLILEPS